MTGKEWVKRLSIVLGSIVILGVLAEVVLHFTVMPYYGIPPYTFVADDEIDYVPNPDFEGRVFNQEHPEKWIEIKMNSDGFRDREIPLEKPEGVFRVITIGDSETFPDTMNLEEQYGKVMEKTMNEQGKQVEVINGGVSGYGTRQSFNFLKRKGMKYNPDMVIYMFVPNDVQENVEHRYTVVGGLRVNYEWKEKPRSAAIRSFVYKNSYIMREGYRIIGAVKRSTSEKKEKVISEEEFAETEKVVKELNSFLKERKIKLLVIITPGKEEVKRDEALKDMVRKVLEEESIEFLDLREEYDTLEEKRSLRWQQDSHLNQKGHQIIAEMIAKKMQTIF